MEITALSIVDADVKSFCSSTAKGFLVTIKNNSGSTDTNGVTGETLQIQVFGPNAVAAANYVVASGSGSMAAGATQVLTFPDHFTLSGNPAAGLDFSTPGTGNTLTVSMTVTGDTSNLNDVESLSGIVVYTPRTPSLSTTASTICQGGNVTYTILLDGSSTPVSTATYTFRLNGGVVQQIKGTNVFAFVPGTIANGDKVTIDVIDGQSNPLNGCIVNTSTITKYLFSAVFSKLISLSILIGSVSSVSFTTRSLFSVIIGSKSSAQSNSTIVERTSNGYIHASYYNGTGTFSTSGASSGMGLFTGTNGSDTYGRSYNAAAARALLNVANGATNVTNNSQISNGRGYITSYTDTNTQLTTAQVRGKVSAGTGISYNSSTGVITNTVTNTNTQRSDSDITEVITKAGFKTTDNNTTYSADGNYGMTLSGTTFRLEDDRRRNSTGTDVYSGNTHDFTWYDASVGIRWYTAGGEDMRLLDNGTLHVDGDVVAYSSTVSDERLKDNIKTIENPLDKIKALRGVEYDWNNGNRKGKHDLGLIAQEVESVIPDIVHEHTLPYVEGEEDTLYKTVDYEKMVAVLIEGMKEQQTQIDSLKSELTEIKGKL